jgi:hypothetical protein
MKCLLFLSAISLFVILAHHSVPAQRLPDVVVQKAAARSVNERVIIKTVVARRTDGVLAVVLDPIIEGEVIVANASGKVIDRKKADKTGQAEFQLPKGQSYTVRASAPGYSEEVKKATLLRDTSNVRVSLTAKFAALSLVALPKGTQILIDGRLRATADQTGSVTIADLEPGAHKMLIRHPEYSDFPTDLGTVDAGDLLSYPKLPLVKVARLTFETLPGALVMIDGALKGKAGDNGQVMVEYQMEQAAEHTLSVALLGYQDWAAKEMLTPGAKTVPVKLTPIVTSAGVGDTFDDLSLWNAPSAWKLEAVKMPNGKNNRKLSVTGSKPGIPKNTLYRDLDANFEIRLPDGKGAAWAVKVDKSGSSYYLFYLAGPNSETPKKFYTYLVKDGQMTQVSTPIPIIADLNQKDSYTIDLTVRGYTIQHSITSNATGEKVDLGIFTDVSDTKNNFLYGTFGFLSFKGENFTVDEFNIQPVK